MPATSWARRRWLHGAGLVIAPCTNGDFHHAAACGWKQRRVPGEEPLLGQGFGIVLRCVEHHLNDTLDLTVGGGQPADIHSQTARDGGAHLLPIEHFAFNLARLQHVLRQGLENGFSPELKTQRLHAPDQASLSMTHFGQPLLFPAKLGPVVQIVDRALYSTHHVRRIYRLFVAKARIFDARHASNKGFILRIIRAPGPTRADWNHSYHELHRQVLHGEGSRCQLWELAEPAGASPQTAQPVGWRYGTEFDHAVRGMPRSDTSKGWRPQDRTIMTSFRFVLSFDDPG